MSLADPHALGRVHALREAGGWLAAALSAALPLSLALIWVEAQTGSDRGLEAAILLDLTQLPPVLAVAEPPPAMPVTAAPEPAAAPQAEPAPLAPVAQTSSTVPHLVQPAPPQVTAPPAQPALPDPGAPPDQPPEPLPQVAEAEAVPQVPALRPKARPAPKPQPDPKPKAQTQPAPAADRSTPATPTSGAGAAAATEAAAARQGNAALEAGWGAAIRKRIERRKAYPKAASGAAGRVTLRLTVATDGTLVGAVVSGSSGAALLDQAALAAVQRAGRLPPAPQGLTDPSHIFTLPMDFSP